MRQLIRRSAKALYLLRDSLWRQGLQQGIAAAVEHVKILENFELNTIVDIGANKGQFSLLSRKLFPNATIIAFEPLKEPASKFEKLFINDSATSLEQVAIGPERKSTVIHVSAKDDSSSLLPINKIQHELYPGTSEIGTLNIRVHRLNDFLGPEQVVSPALLKIDVQGYELETLKGCDDLLIYFDLIYIECSFIELYEGQSLVNDVVDWLHARKLRFSGVYNMSYDKSGNAIQGDFLFSRII